MNIQIGTIVSIKRTNCVCGVIVDIRDKETYAFTIGMYSFENKTIHYFKEEELEILS